MMNEPKNTVKNFNRRKITLILLAILILTVIIGWKPVSNQLYNQKYGAYVERCYQNGTLQVSVKISVEQTEYSHLGTDISIEHKLKNKPVKNGDIVTMSSNIHFRRQRTCNNMSYCCSIHLSLSTCYPE